MLASTTATIWGLSLWYNKYKIRYIEGQMSRVKDFLRCPVMVGNIQDLFCVVYFCWENSRIIFEKLNLTQFISSNPATITVE